MSAAIAASHDSVMRLRAMSARHAARCGPRHRRDSDMPRVLPIPLGVTSTLGQCKYKTVFWQTYLL